uniref:LAGLIDADG endonuclease n=1 Tax=Spizellomyces sp. 'palustris' TaxID=117820 RepID=UPI0010FBCC43|nr:LAGLIDADG endonuclease [Spizellomyces sp. 'palustris']QCQ69035.1 LAGLIDADG endonuclease [Spizellomyces sp. 'palustris']
MIALGEHLTMKGLLAIINIKASHNLGLSPKVQKAFPNVQPVPKVYPLLPVGLDPFWVSGFTAGEGSFSISITKRPKSKLGEAVTYMFTIAQHIRDYFLMCKLELFFGIGKTHARVHEFRCDFIIQDLLGLDPIIAHFNIYNLNNIKSLDYMDWKLGLGIIRSGAHLTRAGMDAIKAITFNINSNRIC